MKLLACFWGALATKIWLKVTANFQAQTPSFSNKNPSHGRSIYRAESNKSTFLLFDRVRISWVRVALAALSKSCKNRNLIQVGCCFCPKNFCSGVAALSAGYNALWGQISSKSAFCTPQKRHLGEIKSTSSVEGFCDLWSIFKWSCLPVSEAPSRQKFG